MKTVSKKLLSLMLVAILLVSAIPFQAFADVEHDPDTHLNLVITSDHAGNHFALCQFPGCTYTSTPEPCEYYNFNGDQHKCSKCGYEPEPGHNIVVKVPAVDPTCTTDGKTAVTMCTMCGETWGPDVVHTTGHAYGEDGVCTECGATKEPVTKQVTIYAGEGHTFPDGSSSKSFTLTVGAAIPVFPTPLDPNGEFMGWYVSGTTSAPDTTQLYDGSWTELVPHWVSRSYEIKFYCVLNNQISTAEYITTVNVTPGTNLGSLVVNSGVLSHEKLIHPGYRLIMNSADYPVKKYINGVFYPLTNTDVADGAWTIYINLTPDTFTLTLNANGGTVTPTTIGNIAYGTKVNLPIPVKPKSVFQGWKDVNGNMYNSSMVYNFSADTTLTAIWSDEALVMLRIYTNGNFSAPDRIVELTSYIRNSKIYREDVVSIINKNYSSTNGYLPVYGLFDDAGWASYQSNPSKLGDAFYDVRKDNGINYIYVMVNGAYSPSTVVTPGSTAGNTTGVGVVVPNNGNAYWVSTGASTGYWVYTDGTTTPPANSGAYWVSTGNGTGYWVYPVNVTPNPTVVYIPGGSNPKTGDNSLIEVAAAVMVLAAAALVTVISLRKKKMM